MHVEYTSMEGVNYHFELSMAGPDTQVPVFSSKSQQVFKDEMHHRYTAQSYEKLESLLNGKTLDRSVSDIRHVSGRMEDAKKSGTRNKIVSLLKLAAVVSVVAAITLSGVMTAGTLPGAVIVPIVAIVAFFAGTLFGAVCDDDAAEMEESDLVRENRFRIVDLGALGVLFLPLAGPIRNVISTFSQEGRLERSMDSLIGEAENNHADLKAFFSTLSDDDIQVLEKKAASLEADVEKYEAMENSNPALEDALESSRASLESYQQAIQELTAVREFYKTNPKGE